MPDGPLKKPQHRNIPKFNTTADDLTRARLRRIIEATGCRSEAAALAIAVADWCERRDAMEAGQVDGGSKRKRKGE